MGKHHEFDDFFGDDDGTPVIDTRAAGRLYRVPLGRLSPNLVNPRTDFGTEDDLIDFGKSLQRRQNQPCPVVSRSAYLKLWSDHAVRIGDVDYVLVSGERRYRGATVVGLPALDCVVDDNVAVDRKTFMEAVVSENVDRQNFDPVEEAYAVQALVAEFGSNRAVAQHFDRVDGWVTQRVLLTNLAREVQDLVRGKTIPLEAARTLGKLARDKDWGARDQLEWWEDEQERRAAASAARSAARKASRGTAQPMPVQQPAALDGQREETQPLAPERQPSFTAVKQPAPVRPAETVKPTPAVEERQVPQPTPARVEAPARPAGEAIPEQREEPGADEEAAESVQPTKRFPYDNGSDALMHLLAKMPPAERATVYEGLGKDPETQAALTT
ncbi:ParB/RepB/Spo0J family partition protein [Streptomyces sp. NPDC059582]|uniref:ParB/RepB/Spo0J family partition protein n=1 Tax=Streptomyces sp. NPDC059582 TaxID=3346875 RepID=UPI003685B3E9